MGTFDAMKQKTEGKIDEVKGDVQMKSGETVKGGMSKIKGKIKQRTADMHTTDDQRYK